MALSHPHWTNCYQVYLPCQIALGFVRISILQQGKAPGGPGGFPLSASKTLCYSYPSSGNLQLRSFSTEDNTFFFPPMHLCDYLKILLFFFFFSFSSSLFFRLCCSYLHLQNVLDLYTTMSKTFREHLGHWHFVRLVLCAFVKLSQEKNLLKLFL